MRWLLHLLTVCFLLFIHSPRCMAVPGDPQDSSAIFTGYMYDVDSIRVLFRKEYLFTTIGAKDFYIKPDEKGFFTLRFDSIDRAAKVSFTIMDNDDYYIVNDFVVEPGDRVNMLATRHGAANFSFLFDGVGAEKYNCRLRIQDAYTKFDNLRALFRTQYRGESLLDIQNLPAVKNINETGEQMMLAQLSGSKNRISRLAHDVMEADIIGLMRHYYDTEIAQFFKTPEDRFAAYTKYHKQLPVYADLVYALSKNICEYILRKESRELYFSNKFSQYDFSKLYFHLKNKYSGRLKERLLMNLIVSSGGYGMPYVKDNYSDYEKCLMDAVTVVTYPPLYDLIKTRFDRYTKGSTVYNFALPDSSGKVVKLADFKGKVVLIDVWGTGCVPCAMFYKRFEKLVASKYDGKSEFEVVSISLDKDKQRWQKSVASGLYTNQGHVNLYLAENPNNNPFVKFYDLVSIPFVLLVDKNGKVIAKINDPEEFEVDKVISMIDEYIYK